MTRPTVPPVYTVDFAAPVPHSARPGMVAGLCGHGVAPSEWRAGCRYCERCTPITSSLAGLLPALRPVELPAGAPIDADDLAEQLHQRLTDLVDRLMIPEEGFLVDVDLGRGEVTVVDADDEDLVLARGVITGPGVSR